MSFCVSCFKEFDDEYDICPFCGTVKTTEPKQPIHLYPGTRIGKDGRYIIGLSVGEGGFGVVYKAWDSKLETIVAIKEFFFTTVMTRSAGSKEVIIIKNQTDEFQYRRERFLAEARYMAKFGSHPNIVNVYDFFEENDTAYIVMELLDGVTLDKYLKNNGNKISEEEITHIAIEVGNALDSMHKEGIIHRDVAPDNIFMCSNGVIKLMDIGSAKLAGVEEDVIDKIEKPGYTPPEQYAGENAKIGPFTDVYALGATMYRSITGAKPQESTDRKIEDKTIPPHILDEHVSENFSNIIMKAIAIDAHMRFKDIPELMKALNGERKVVSLEQEKKFRKRKRFSGIAVAMIILIIAGVVVGNSYQKQKKEERLDPANIEIWFCIEDDSEFIEGGKDDGKSSEELALLAVASDFEDTYEGIKINVRGIPESEYETELINAAKLKKLPALFESTGVDNSILEKSGDLSKIIESEQFANTPILSKYYSKKYKDKKQLPLGFVAPAACVVTSAPVSIEYKASAFSKLSDFGDGTKVSCDDIHLDIFKKNFGADEVKGMQKSTAFYNIDEATSAVLVTTTDRIAYIQKAFKNYGYKIKFISYDSKNIECDFTYEWSIGNGDGAQIRASECLLTYMLGNKYQNDLMVSWCTDGQMPVNPTIYKDKCDKDSSYAAFKDLYNKCKIS